MEIDHIAPPPAPENGGSERPPQNDSWANLQELTNPDHRRKTAKDNPGASKKGGVTKGFPVMAIHVASGKEDLYASVRAAASTLGLPLATVQKRIRQGSSKEYRGYVFRRCPKHTTEQDDRPGEVWKDAELHGRLIKGIRVSTMGRVQLRYGRRTEGWIVNNRRNVKLRVDGRTKDVKIYVLMAYTFIGRPPSAEHTVDHIDGNSIHDVIWNLRWATRVEQGRNIKSNRAVHKYDLQGKLLQTHGTIAEAAEKNRLSRQQVKYAASTGSTVTGFRWNFVQQVADP